MTNAILPGMTHSETPHAAPTPGFGAASRVDEGRTASAKPRWGALLSRGKSFGAMLCIALGAALPAFGAVPTLNSPAKNACLATLKGTTTEEGSHKWFFYGLSTANRKSLMNFELYGPYDQNSTKYDNLRAMMGNTYGDQPKKTTFSWSGTGPFTLTIKRPDGSVFMEKSGIAGTSLAVDNFEIAALYTWTVSNADGVSAPRSFTTEDTVPRLLNGSSQVDYTQGSVTIKVPHGVRDMGGYIGRDGRRARQGLLIRNSAFESDYNEDQHSTKYIDDTNRSFWKDFLGIKTEIDLRNNSESQLTESTLGSDVSYLRVDSISASKSQIESNVAGFTTGVKNVFQVLADSANYPITIHGTHGKDRTGVIAFLIGCVLGYSSDDLYTDYESTIFWHPTQRVSLETNDGDGFVDFLNDSTASGATGATIQEKAVSFLKVCGVTDAQLDAIREIMLEPNVEDDPDDVVTVTLGDHPHLAAAWTSGDGSVTNAVDGTSFEVTNGTTNVKVIFTAESGWEIVGDAVVELGTVTSDIVFGNGNDYMVPQDVPAGGISYLDYDANTGTFTNAVRECTLVTSETRTLENGWYAVMGEVVIPEGERLVVQGTAHLILCDGAKLNVEKPGKDNAGVNVSGDASLVIYGQTAGTGVLTATGGGGGAGIGGGKRGAVGTVTINGGTVMATGGDYGAGIGGGDYGAGGTVTINGGTVTAAGEWGGSGIGGGYTGACGVVTINGGTVTAIGTSGGAGIGGGGWVAGGIVTINGGTVTAIGMSGGVGIGGTGPGCGTVRISGGSVYVEGAGEVIATSEEPESGSVQISGGIFNIPIPAKWCAPRFALSVNPDPATRNTYRYTVVLGKKVTIGDYPYLLAVWTSGDGTMTNEVEGSSFYVSSGTENVSVHFATEPNSVYSIEEDTVLLGTVMDDIVFGEGNEYTVPRIYFGDIAYLDWDGSRMTNAILSKYDYTLVTPNTQEMVDGWYVVATNIERGGIAVKGSVNLFIADGCEFKVECIDVDRPGIEVFVGQSTDRLRENGWHGCPLDEGLL